jgi:hypothetical protein
VVLIPIYGFEVPSSIARLNMALHSKYTLKPYCFLLTEVDLFYRLAGQE